MLIFRCHSFSLSTRREYTERVISTTIDGKESSVSEGLRLYNTDGRRVESFVPINEGRVGMYCCGPTVYDYAHIGNLRTYVFEDILRRVLERIGYSVTHVMNITDVGHLTGDGDDGEDRMLVGARKTGRTVWEIAEFYTDAFFADTEALNITRPTVVCKATEHIDEMIGLIRRLEERGMTYQSGGNVYYDIGKFASYGDMARLDREGLRAGARIEVDEGKRNPHDFVLWFTKGKFEQQAMLWDSPWGRGYPGWHLECSAMSVKYLGEHFDIHCGGVDHINVHHTNEIAQTEGATGTKWVNFWMHGEFLVMETAKMAKSPARMGKSEGNAITLSTVIDRGYEPLDYRYYLLGAHYRTQLSFTWEALAGAKAARASLVALVRDLATESSADDVMGDAAREVRKEIDEAFSNDLNAPQALGVLRAVLKDGSIPAGQRLAIVLDADQVLGLDLADVVGGAGRQLPDDLAELIARREEARKSRDFGRADELRDELKGRGVLVEDTPSGTKWKWGQL